VLHQAQSAGDVAEAFHVLDHLANLIGISFVAAQTVLNDGKTRKDLQESELLDGHPWLTQIEFIDAAANFWKHHAQWTATEWDLIEGSILPQLPKRASPAGRTAGQLAGLGIKRSDGARNIPSLAKKLGYIGFGEKWLLDPITAWYVPTA